MAMDMNRKPVSIFWIGNSECTIGKTRTGSGAWTFDVAWQQLTACDRRQLQLALAVIHIMSRYQATPMIPFTLRPPIQIWKIRHIIRNKKKEKNEIQTRPRALEQGSFTPDASPHGIQCGLTFNGETKCWKIYQSNIDYHTDYSHELFTAFDNNHQISPNNNFKSSELILTTIGVGTMCMGCAVAAWICDVPDCTIAVQSISVGDRYIIGDSDCCGRQLLIR